jgi:hypothetical protein
MVKLVYLALLTRADYGIPVKIQTNGILGYGGGLIIAPFKKALLNGTVGFSENRTVIHLRIGYLF